jgi:hypothetical protein
MKYKMKEFGRVKKKKELRKKTRKKWDVEKRNEINIKTMKWKE